MKQTHIASFSLTQLPALSRVSQRNMLDALSCPLCAYTTDIARPDLDDHILQHLHEFALRCLPWVVNYSDGGSITASSSYGCHSSAFSWGDSDNGKLDYPDFSAAECLADLLTNMVDTGNRLKESDLPESIRISSLFEHAGIWDRIDSANKNLRTHLKSLSTPRDPLGEIWGSYILRIGEIFRQLSKVNYDITDAMEVAKEAKEMLGVELDDLNTAFLRKQRGK